MALNISESQFVLPSNGPSPAESLNALQNKLFQRNLQKERIGLAQEGKREQAGNFIKDYLNPEHYLTGTAYDPVINVQLHSAMSKAAEMAAGGADIPTIQMAIGPDVQKISDYSTKAKVINKQSDDMIAKMKENGYKGYDYASLKDEALKSAFHDETGGLKDISKVDPSVNYIMQTIHDNPERVTNAGDFDAFAKESPMFKRGSDIKAYDANGALTERKVHLTGQDWLVPDVDKKGATTDLVPKYDIAADNGQPIIHTFNGPEGKPVQAPVRLLDESVFDDLMSQKHGAADFMRGLVKQHLQEYKSATGESIDLGSPRAKLVARALAYDELNKRKGGGIEYMDIANKPSAAQIQLHVFGDKEQQAYDRTTGTVEAKQDLGVGPGSKSKDTPVDAMNKIFNNDPDYLKGAIVTLPTGNHGIDVTNSFPKGQLKFGPGAAATYKKIIYDPKDRTVTFQKKDNTYTDPVTESKIPQTMYGIAGPNGISPGSIKPSVTKAGFVNGKYTKAAPVDEILSNIDRSVTAATQAKQATGVDEIIDTGKGTSLIGTQGPEGKIVEASKTSKLNLFGDKYYITSKNAAGKPVERRFNTKKEMLDYLAKPNAEALREKYPD